MASTDLIPSGAIEGRIFVLRGQKVILDSDLAALYGVTTSRLNEQVKRNADRFPGDFMFEVTDDETANLRSQIAISSAGYGGRRHTVKVFTEHGAVMAASVLNSRRAVEVSVYVVRAFVRLREALATHQELATRLDDLERIVGDHGEAIRDVVAAIRQLMAPPIKGKARPIGFRPVPDPK